MKITKSTIYLNDEQETEKKEKTFVVLGMPRSGTSMLSGICHLAGIPMGDFSYFVDNSTDDLGNAEDVDF